MAVLGVSTLGWIIRVVITIVLMVLIYVICAGIISKFKIDPDEEPDPDDVVPVNERFRCIVCGAEVTMTSAQAGTDPEAPRHCREDMVPVD